MYNYPFNCSISGVHNQLTNVLRNSNLLSKFLHKSGSVIPTPCSFRKKIFFFISGQFPLPVFCNSTPGHNTMQVDLPATDRGATTAAAPSMENRDHSCFCAQVFFVFPKRFDGQPTGFKQSRVDFFSIYGQQLIKTVR